MTKKEEIIQSTQYRQVVFYRTQEDDRISLGKIKRFRQYEVKRFLTNPLSGHHCNQCIIHVGKRKSETDLRKMTKIMEELLKTEKNDKNTFLTCTVIRKEGQKANKTF